jgi:hypothetical protein
MDNFFTFVDKIDKPIFLLYDKNFIHINKYLLSSLGFTPQNRPGSLTQIIDSKWKNKLIALKMNEEIDVPLIMKGGKVRKYQVRMHPLEIEKSEYLCFILSVKDIVDQNLDIANRIFSKIPFPAFNFNKELEIIQINNALENLKKVKIKSFDDIKKIFQVNEIPDFTKSDIHSFLSVNRELELFIFKPLPGLSYNFFTGVINQSTQFEKGIDIEYLKSSISQSIQRLIKVQKLYSNQSNISQSIWEGIHNEITSLGRVKRHLDNDSSSVSLAEMGNVELNKLIINEIEILKSNDFFRKSVKLFTQFSENLKPLHDQYANVAGNIIPLIDQTVEIACLRENSELYIETIEEDDQLWLKVFINDGGKSSKEKTKMFNNLKNFETQFTNADVKFSCNINSKKNIDLSVGFEI